MIRISGPACLAIYHTLCPGKKSPKVRTAVVRTLYEPHDAPTPDSILDSSALVLFFPSPRTATGQDVLELHVHGGPAIVKAVLAAIPRCAVHGSSHIRYAEPGEFTKRAFLNDRLDLTQVEALGDTLAASTEQQRRLSVRGTTGTLSKSYEAWRQQLLYARGELEALIDFSEDQHFDESPVELCASVASQVSALKGLLQVHCANAVRGELLRNGITLSLLGAPNAGKSSLLNRVVGREAAIVSREAGTTRDVVEVGLDLGGYLCRLGDTAGLRNAKGGKVARPGETVGEIEREGIRRAKERATESDVVIVVVSFEMIEDGTVYCNLDPEVVTTAASLVRTNDNVIIALNKSDLASEDDATAARKAILSALPGLSSDRIHLISCTGGNARTSTVPGTGKDVGNIQAFLQALTQHFSTLTAALTPAGEDDQSIWQESLGASERHRLLLQACIESLDSFLAEVYATDTEIDGQEHEPDIVVAAEHLRSAADCLAKITGQGMAGDVEEVLGVVFEKFCVGK